MLNQGTITGCDIGNLQKKPWSGFLSHQDTLLRPLLLGFMHVTLGRKLRERERERRNSPSPSQPASLVLLMGPK